MTNEGCGHWFLIYACVAFLVEQVTSEGEFHEVADVLDALCPGEGHDPGELQSR